MARYLHLVGAFRRDRMPHLQLAAPHVLADCHRGLRGPYTGVDSVLTEVLPIAYARWPELVDYHRLELLDGLPELAELIGPAPTTLASEAPFGERTRWYSSIMVRCMSQGIITFLREYARRMRAAGEDLPVLVFESVHEADQTTQEFIELFLRRVGADLWQAIVASNGELPESLSRQLADCADRQDADPVPSATGLSDAELAAIWVNSDGTSDDPAALAGYLAVAAADRAALHDRRADELAPAAGWGVRVAALTLHRERGSDPLGAGVRALMEATEYCTAVGFSAMVIELGQRGRALIEPDRDPESYRKFSHMLIASLVAFRRLDEATEICHELRRRYALPLVHMTTSYFLAMISTRFAEPRDHEKAVEWQNNAMVIANGLPDEHQRLVLSGFQENGMALIEMHRGNLVRALDLVETAMARLDERLAPDEWALHRSQLLYNQTRLLAGLGRKDEAFAAFGTLIEMDPHYTDYLSERAKISRKRGDLTAAIADYDRAIEIGPPFPEVFHNRGSAYVELGEDERGLADFDFVLDMEPDDVETRLSRAELLLQLDDPASAEADVEHALRLQPRDARLLCLRGVIALADGQAERARADFDAALAVDSSYPAALINRAVAAFELGQPEPAAEDLTHALELSGEDPDLLLNRGIAYASAGRLDQALADFDRALALPGADVESLTSQRQLCLAGAG